LRPAVLLIEEKHDLTVCFITSQINWKETTDIELLPTVENGIKKASLIRLSKIATVDKTLSIGKIGGLNSFNIIELNKNLKTLLQL
jgi:mRNA interferase MazF